MNILYYPHIIIITIITLLFQLSAEDVIIPCLQAQECKSLNGIGESIKCSMHGKCFYDLFNYIIANNSDLDFLTCVCDDGYSDYELTSDSVRCCYQQKDQFTAFILEVIPGFGAGHWYIGNKSQFLAKCIIVCALILTIIVIEIFLWCKRAKDSNICNSENANNNNIQRKEMLSGNSNNSKVKVYEMILSNLVVLFFGIIIIWQIVDTILFGINFYYDNNNMPLKQW